MLDGGDSLTTGAAWRANAALGVGALVAGGGALRLIPGGGSLGVAGRTTAATAGAAASADSGGSLGAGDGVGGTGAAMPMSVCERSGLCRTELGTGARVEPGASIVMDGGGADDGVAGRTGTGTAMPMSVLERSGLVVFGRGVIVADVLGGAEDRAAGTTDSDARGGADARGGCDARGGATDGAATGAFGDALAAAPQSVSMSSVDGGTDGSGVRTRGGWLEAGRGGTDDVRA